MLVNKNVPGTNVLTNYQKKCRENSQAKESLLIPFIVDTAITV